MLTKSEVKEIIKPIGIVKKLHLQKELDSILQLLVAYVYTTRYLSKRQLPVILSIYLMPVLLCNLSLHHVYLQVPSKWRPSIMNAIEDSKLTPEIIVRDLVTHMYGFMEKPTTNL